MPRTIWVFFLFFKQSVEQSKQVGSGKSELKTVTAKSQLGCQRHRKYVKLVQGNYQFEVVVTRNNQ